MFRSLENAEANFTMWAAKKTGAQRFGLPPRFCLMLIFESYLLPFY